MSSQPTYRSVVQNLVAALEKEHGDNLSGWGIDAALGSLADVYRQAKALTTDEQAPTMFITREPDGRHDASIANAGLSDITVVVVDKTIFDKDGPLISIGSDDGMVFSATVKMVQPSPTNFDTEKVLDVAKREPYRNGVPVFTGMERSINQFLQWKKDSRPFHLDILQKACNAISEHGFEAYSDVFTDGFDRFKASLLKKAKQHEPGSDEDVNEARMKGWLNESFSVEDTENAVVVAIYELGMDRVQEALEVEPSNSPSI
jgi:hypothetical protein